MLILLASAAYAAEQPPTDSMEKLTLEINKLRFDLKENLISQLRAQRMLQDLSWRTERLRTSYQELEDVHDEIALLKEKLDTEKTTKSEQNQVPTFNSNPTDSISPAGTQENINKFQDDIAKAQKREQNLQNEISEHRAKINELNLSLKQVEEEVRSR